MSKIVVRPERDDDVDAVHSVNERAFGQPDEAGIVDTVRAQHAGSLSLVAERDGVIVGHILFSPVTLGDSIGMGLAPMAVAPDHQRQGVGSALVECGLEMLRSRGTPFVVVLGHPTYYPRFAFVPAWQAGVRCQWDGVDDEAFMILVFDKARTPEGVARYVDAFAL